MGYALIQHGLDERQRRARRLGLEAPAYAVPRLGHPRARQHLRGARHRRRLQAAARGAARTTRRSSGLRPKMERYLRNFELVRLPATTYYGNHWLIEAVLVQELLTTGLTSTNAARGAGRRAPRGRAPVRRADQRADPGDGPRARRRASAASGPSSSPTRPTTRWPTRACRSASTRARSSCSASAPPRPRAGRCIQVANASTWLTAPDGDLAYFGRNQEQAWALGGTAYGAEVAAGLRGVDAARRGPLPRARPPRARAAARRARHRPLRPEHHARRAGESRKGGAEGRRRRRGRPVVRRRSRCCSSTGRCPRSPTPQHEPTRIRVRPRRAGRCCRAARAASRSCARKNVWFAVRDDARRQAPGGAARRLRADGAEDPRARRQVAGRRAAAPDHPRRGRPDRLRRPGAAARRPGCARSRSREQGAVERDGTVDLARRPARRAEPVQADRRARSRTGRSCARSTSPPAR